MAHRYLVRNFVDQSTAGWTPASLTGLIAWYDASNAGSITQSGGLVSQWNDLSGNGHHLTQATSANQPTTGVAIQNSLNGIQFSSAAPIYMTATGSITEAPTVRYIAVVWRTANHTLNNQALWVPSSSDAFEYRLLTNDSGTGNADVLESGVAHHTAAGEFTYSVDSTTYLYEVLVDTSAHTIKYWHNSTHDGTNTDTFTFSSAGSTYTMSTNAGGYANDFVVFETVMADATPSAGDLTSLRSYMSTKWAY